MLIHGFQGQQIPDSLQRHRESRKQQPRPPSRQARRAYRVLRLTENACTYPKVDSLGYLEQSRLIARAQRGDIAARNVVWMHNARLVYSVIAKQHIPERLLPDAMQEGQLGLAAAIDRFEIERLNAFSTYAVHWIRQRIRRLRPMSIAATRIPSHHWERFRQYSERVVNANDRSTWYDERERMLDEDPKRYRQVVRIYAIARPTGLKADPQLPDYSCPLDRLLRIESAQRIAELVSRLDDRLQVIIRHRFVLRTQATLKQVGIILGLTRERVRQLEAEALGELCRMLEGNEHPLAVTDQEDEVSIIADRSDLAHEASCP